jgi:putative endonuclease
MYYVYIVECADKKFYTGITDNVERRFKEHQRQGSHFTSYNHATKLLYKESFPDKNQAAKRERQIKGWTRRKKLALAAGNLQLLKLL